MTLDLSALDVVSLDAAEQKAAITGEPLIVPMELVYEDPNNPRTEFKDDELQELADDIAQRGIIQPIVVWPRDERGYKIRFGAKRRRAAELAATKTGIDTVPVTLNANPDLDDYAQIAENVKRSGLSALDMAKFIKRKVDAGATHAVVAERLGIARPRVSEFLALFNMPASIELAYNEGRCVNPRVLDAVIKLHRKHGSAVDGFMAEATEITHSTVAAWERMLISGGAAAIGTNWDQTSAVVAGAPNTAAPLPSSDVSSQTTKAPGRKNSSSKLSARPDPNITNLEQRMTEALGARSGIRYNETTKSGTISIRFTSLDELEGLLKRFKIPRE